jgi:hypothetical protein
MMAKFHEKDVRAGRAITGGARLQVVITQLRSSATTSSDSKP